MEDKGRHAQFRTGVQTHHAKAKWQIHGAYQSMCGRCRLLPLAFLVTEI